ncbi:uncharacterized protein METZ01_LOCUS77127 [marine metagenome]|uniref:Fe2OG dioxygenase domain-containing protein n=1 Tax=marine metagenome TaxID=408172 RepID=A0A381UCD3_9ZZZZ
MNIVAIDDIKDLFQIKDVISNETMNKLSKVELKDVSWTKQEWQEDWKRRKLDVAPDSIFEQIQKEINSQAELIGAIIGRTIIHINVNFWLDLPGFTVTPHIDNPAVDNAFQLYLKDCDNAGTVFYNIEEDEIEIRDDAQKWHYFGDEVPSSYRHTFNCVKNTGYIMLNNKLQLHGVPTTLGKDDLRLSAYCLMEE